MDALKVLSIIFIFLQVMAAEGQDSKENSGISGLAGYFFRLRPVSVNPDTVNARSLKEDGYVTFHLYNRVEQRSRGRSVQTKKRFQKVDQERIGDTVAKMNSSLPTMIIIHGFLESYDAVAIKGLLTALNRKGKWNVIVVDWRKLSAGPWYPWALLNTRAVGRYVATFIDSVAATLEAKSKQTDNDIPRAKRSTASAFLKDLHIVGFSLGAQVAGIAGHYVTAGKVGRITGLDPAYPLIEILGPKSEQLDESDAEFVDVIHTSGGTYGVPYAIGHADFFPNGGKSVQPGCSSLLFPLVCSHWRAWRFFSESILNEQSFESLPCDSYKKFNDGDCDHFMNDANNGPEYMGVGASRRARGKYYLKTYPEPPFSMPL
ncbi:pancreatic lipase-related protein 2-like [Ischnura elegans]|uniref:pancreatic lipase-related protein 2-like n=1 Tax=Ischnura elegans TaxID=197161 RepID=UPI001ED86D86|nr:pancreatic lipase-related protein 2-like [Ischnura elegans]